MREMYGTLAEFNSSHTVVAAARQIWENGYRHVEAYAPCFVEGLAEAIGFKKTRVPLITLLGGIIGGVSGYFMMWYAAVISYPLNVGGRPLHSWPAFVPITFELTILIAAVSTGIGMLALNGLPQPYHPIFNSARFTQNNASYFYLCVKATDPHYDAQAIHLLLQNLGAQNIQEVLS